jgi:hypothetical protein
MNNAYSSTPNGVDYITKNNKEKQRNNNVELETSSVSSGQDSVLKDQDPTRGMALASMLTPSPTPLQQRDIKRCVVQLFDNGEESRQRYKLKVRLNLVDGEDVDFIAPLTKDARNFLKHTVDRELARNWKIESYQLIQKQYAVKPWLGKFHLVRNSYTSKHHVQVVEPNCFATVWWDDEARDWTATIMLYDFSLEDIDLQSRNVQAAQKAAGCRSSKIWTNPDHQHSRPPTWAEMRAAK